MPRRAVMMFSGGVDSTYVASRMAEVYDEIVLLTFRTPGMVRVDASGRRARMLQERFPDRFRHEILDIREDVERLRGGVSRTLRDNVRHGFLYAWCLGCKTTMHLTAMKYARRNGISVVLDGSTSTDAHALEQHEDVETLIQSLYAEEGITYRSPFRDEQPGEDGSLAREAMRHMALYKDATQARREYLIERDLDPGLGFFSQYRVYQPSCLISPLFNLPRVPLKLVVDEKRRGGHLEYVRKLWREGCEE